MVKYAWEGERLGDEILNVLLKLWEGVKLVSIALIRFPPLPLNVELLPSPLVVTSVSIAGAHRRPLIPSNELGVH